MLRWQFDSSIGTVTEVYPNGNEFTYTLYKGNAFMIALYQYDYQEDGTFTWSMHWFWADKEHMKNCLGVGKNSNDGSIYEGKILRFKFNEKANKSDLRELVCALVKSDQAFSIERGLYDKKRNC